mgnify:CR=1 FL=1
MNWIVAAIGVVLLVGIGAVIVGETAEEYRRLSDADDSREGSVPGGSDGDSGSISRLGKG